MWYQKYRFHKPRTTELWTRESPQIAPGVFLNTYESFDFESFDFKYSDFQYRMRFTYV